ncbi:hypothetical protein CJ030_MR5G025113 [Morella rubra]|uniref:Uncharacterized protein n=1 Tax=Morella rubra TaxID=262757 RepID=A0A6A1VID1_9ROSI|nr:hypothetical protein CJ030_MR5G025113 [Morella rubra]
MNKEEWTRVCDLFASEEFQRRSAINKENRAKLKIVHTSGARSFQRARALLKNPESDEISLRCFIKRRILIRMACGHQKMHEKILYGADDARASVDDGGAATEERRRADADDGRAAMKKRRRAPEDDGGAAKDPSGTTRTEDATNGEQMREQLVEQIRQLQSRSTPKRKFG